MKRKTLEQQYSEIVKNTHFDLRRNVWEKEGDNFKRFSLFDHSDYSTSTVTANV